MARLDHVVIAVKDADQAAASLFGQFGLAAYAGGRILGIGTESHIVPIGDGFLEIISVYDEREAVANPLGRAVLAATAESRAKFLTWAVEPTASAQHVAERLELAANPMKRALPDGGDVTCNIVGLQQAIDDPSLPYFVEWATKEERPDQVDVKHDISPTGFAWLELVGDKQQVEKWTGDSTIPLEWAAEEERRGVQAVAVITAEEPVILRAPLDLDTVPERPMAVAEPAEQGVQPSDKQKATMFECVLGSVEHAVESAAEVVESVAGQLLSPRTHISSTPT